MPHSFVIPLPQLITEIRQAFRQGWAVRIRVTGHSMRYFLHHLRDDVRLEPVRPEQLRVGDVVLAGTVTGVYVLHRIIRREGCRLTLQGDGNLQQKEYCLTSQVVGKATAFYRKNRPAPDLVTGLKWRSYSAIWLMLRPVRRWLLGGLNRLCPVTAITTRRHQYPLPPALRSDSLQHIPMKQNPHFTLRQICGEQVLIATGQHCLDYSHLMTLNDSAVYLWQALNGKDFDLDTLTDLLCNRYDVTPNQARTDARIMLDEWIRYGLVQ